MKNWIPGAALLAAVMAMSPAALDAQNCWVMRGNPADRPSPLDSAVVDMGGDMVKVCYGAPSAKGRTMVGDGGEHDYGEPWRTGANEATSIHLPFAATVAGVEVDAGSYSLYTVPGADSWGIFLNRTVERWGIPINAAVTAENVGSGSAPSVANDHTERMTMSFENAMAGSATLVLRWEGYRVEIPVTRR